MALRVVRLLVSIAAVAGISGTAYWYFTPRATVHLVVAAHAEGPRSSQDELTQAGQSIATSAAKSVGVKVVGDDRKADGELRIDVGVLTRAASYTASPGVFVPGQHISAVTGADVTSTVTLLLDGRTWKQQFTVAKPADDSVPVGATGAAANRTMYDFLSMQGSLATALYELFADAFGPRAVAGALRAWSSGPTEMDRAAQVLAARKDGESVRLLSGAINDWRFWMGDQRGEIRARAIEAAGWSGQRAHLDALVKALDAADHVTRSFAVRALEQLGDPAAIEPLSRVAENDDDAGNRDQAKRAIEKLRTARR